MDKFYIDELISKLIEMRSDGFFYCQLCFNEKDDEFQFPSSLSFSAEDCGGLGLVDYESVDSVSQEEISEYAYQHKTPPVNRKKFFLMIILRLKQIYNIN